MVKHKKPRSAEPSKYLVEWINKTEIPKNKPVVDVACGYGRNGAFLVDKGFRVVFTDINRDSLDFIADGISVSENGDIDLSLVKIFCTDITRCWPFPPDSLSGIVNVHYYQKDLLTGFISSIQSGGFIYLETVPARKENSFVLERNHEMISAFEK